ncbi:MAG: tRNA (N(6)-L-threonylcarbamoyladenosine(37)-C(2))-methylthiotransferase MtaB [Bacteroidales bacterium]|nr:tRNA (N(6)-L-threonylcarbamoyladenosine(37)-C(2))-methylthiotransferase MtaB [Bacteroidales bacterium]
MATVAFHTLGCKLNFSETSAMSRKMQAQGYVRVEFDEVSDVYVINTCSVTEEANKKCRQMIKRCIRLNPQAYIIVTGCYAQLEAQQVADIEGVDLVLGSNEKTDILEHIDPNHEKVEQTVIHVGAILKDKVFKPSFSSGDRTRTFLKVQDGCDYFCTYCTIPLARGASRSASLEDTLQEAQRAAHLGAKEIILTGVNIGDFGHRNGETFLQLVEGLERIEGVERYRISSIEPNLLTEEVLQHVAQSKKFMPHFHIPLQSGCDEVLKLMHRRYDTAFFKNKVERVIELIPNAFIGIDVIVGTNGETEEYFQKTVQFLEEIPYAFLHVFTYSERPNTMALKIKPVVEMGERHKRNEVLQRLSHKRHEEFLRRFIGEEMNVLVESGNHDGYMYGFTENYIKVCVPYDEALDNTIIKVKLTEDNLVDLNK